MSKITRIAEYETLTDEELIAEVKQRRREIQQPKLDWIDRLSNFLVSIPGIGGSIAMLSAFIYQIFQPPKDGFGFTDRMEIFTGEWFGRKGDENGKGAVKKDGFKKAWQNFTKDENFKRNIIASGVVFAVISAISLFVIEKIQRGERSEDNATKHMFGEEVLRERGYVQIDGQFMSRLEAKKHYQELDDQKRVEKPEQSDAALATEQKQLISRLERLEQEREALVGGQVEASRGL